MYSAFVNKRLYKYLENNNILAEEQHGFRKDRSCEDHVFVLNSLINNKSALFRAFIDLRKAFEFKDRDMLLYELLLNRVNGKVYNSIKSIYTLVLNLVYV